MSTIVWLRRDLRLHDNPALLAASRMGEAVIPVYIHSPHEDGAAAPGGAAGWWLGESLQALSGQLAARASRLIIRRGDAATELLDLIAATKATTVLWNRRYEPDIIQRDSAIKNRLRAVVGRVESSNAALLYEPMHLRNKSGEPYKVFTPFWRACLALGDPTPPAPAPSILPAPKQWPDSLGIQALGLKPVIPWDRGMAATWTPGETAALRHLAEFADARVSAYGQHRDIPSIDGTSRLSAHLAFGEISPRTIWNHLRGVKAAVQPGVGSGAQAFLRQLGWREFAHHLLYHFPATVAEPMRPEFAAFPWQTAGAALRSWQRGHTGYPIVDAGMRQLWHTGWMHNRVRMLVGSFLVKDLLIPWQEGARWFWDTLVDADLANNTMGWQWIAGCGADAAPYFRIFNPSSQGQRFDADGAFIRAWVPELARLPAAAIHQPAAADASVLRAAGVKLGDTYPEPIVDHARARFRALHAYEQIKRAKGR